MRKPIVKILLALIVLAIVAVGLYNIPFIHAKLAWRLDNIRTSVYYFFNPPQKVVFQPSQQALLTQTVVPTPAAPTSTPTPLTTDSVPPTPTSTPLPGSVILNNIVYVHQMQRWNYCGPANLTMALEYWGWKGDPNSTLELRDQIGTVVKPGINDPSKDFIDRGNTDVNVMPYELVDFVNDHTTYRALFRYGGDLDLAKRLIAAGFPFIAEKGIYEPLPPEGTLQWGGHYAFTTGYDDSQQMFTWQDSYLPEENSNGKNNKISYTDYLSGWRAFNYVFVVVYPADREAELLNILGPWADQYWAAQHALDIANQEIPTLTGNDKFFAMFNRVTSLIYLQEPQYGEASAAYDQANSYYNTALVGQTKQPIPYRIMWYQTSPYFAYYWTGRYQDVINLANSNLKTILTPRSLEESWFWKARAEYALGDFNQAYEDMRQALYYHPGFQAALDMMTMWGVNP